MACARRRNAYDGKQRDDTASIAHWYDSTGQGRSGVTSAGTITVVAVASGRPFMSVVR